MRAHGINYDTGFLPGDKISRRHFDPADVRRDMRAIARDLHCDVVRVSGGDPDRLIVAARLAAEAGLEVWVAPFPVDLVPAAMLDLFRECAEPAEELRAGGTEVVFVTGCEVSVFGKGFFPGETYAERLQNLSNPDPAFWESLGPVEEHLNGFLTQAATEVRKHFGGRVTYAAGPWEQVDWSQYGLVGSDAYRAVYNQDTFVADLRALFRHGKPVAVTEFGTCAYTGAGERGGMAWAPPEDAVADESEQVRYFTELMDRFEAEGVDTALWFTFANFNAIGAQEDLKSYGVVRMTGPSSWEPKQVFQAMARRYGATVRSRWSGTP